MKRLVILAVAMVLSLGVLLRFAWNRSLRPSASVSQFEPEPEVLWKLFEPKDGRYHILFPGDPKEQLSKSSETTGSVVSSHGWVFDSEELGASFFIFHFDSPLESRKVDDVLDATCITVAQQIQGELVEARKLSIENYPGREIAIAGRGTRQGSLQISRFYYVKGRHYHLGVAFRRESVAPECVSKYLNSFRLIER